VARNPVLILCEGENDYNFLKSIITERTTLSNYNEKDRTIRKMWMKIYPTNAIIIVEGGKERLLRNASILVSKMRSIPKNQNILIMVDCNRKTPKRMSEDIHRRICNIINDPMRFPTHKPTAELKPLGYFHFLIQITYPTSTTLSMHVLTVPHSLEYWTNKVNDFNQLIRERWVKELIATLEHLGVKTIK